MQSSVVTVRKSAVFDGFLDRLKNMGANGSGDVSVIHHWNVI